MSEQLEIPRTNSGDRSLGELFVAVTGETTVTERQLIDARQHAPPTTEELALSEYIAAAARADGLADTMDQPDLDWPGRD